MSKHGRTVPVGRTGIAALLLAPFLSVLAGTDPPDSAKIAKHRGVIPAGAARNLILISVDTLRADRLGCYGYGRPTSPSMDSLAGRGVRFANALAESSWTLPSHMSLFTGLHPTTHGVVRSSDKLHPGILTFPQILKKKGFRTIGYTGGGFVHGRFGFDRGFDIYDSLGDRNFAGTFRLARERIEEIGFSRRFFLFLHTYDVHCPYNPPTAYSRMFVSQPPENRIDTSTRCGATHYNNMRLTEGQVEHISDQYDAEIRAVDDALGEFVKYLDERDLLRSTLLVILSDHGEEIREHGKIGHGENLYLESLRVPMMMVGSRIEPRVVGAAVGLVDVMPTLLSLLGIVPPPSQGRSLVPLMAGCGSSAQVRPLHSEVEKKVRLRSVVEGDLHLVIDFDHGGIEMFDIRRDPLETTDIREARKAAASRLEEMLRSHRRALPAGHRMLTRPPSSEELEKLRSLGYVD